MQGVHVDRMPKAKIKFEDYIEQIDAEIKKRRSKWNLTALSWMDFDDVSQILRIHIFKKWHLYDTKKPLNPWINRIISNQIKNLIRNNYGNYCRPCLKCAAAEAGDLCYIYGKQSEACPLSEEDAATLMGYKTNEKNRVPGYKQIKNVKKAIIKKVKRMLEDGEIEIL